MTDFKPGDRVKNELKPLEAAVAIIEGKTLITRDGYTCKWDGEGVQIGDGFKYLLTGLRLLEGEQITEAENG